MLMFANQSTSPVPGIAPPHKLRIKVCGMKFAENIAAVAMLEPDFMGFIFYSKTPRYAGEMLDAAQLRTLPASIRRVGVFVNETTEIIVQQALRFGLDLVQLHGDETPAQCAGLRAAGLPVMKAFAVSGAFDFAKLTAYAPYCTYFLFDTAGEGRGGNGTTFDWNILREYSLAVPYFLAGGLDISHLETLRDLQLPGLFAIDLNSRFEMAPGEKDVVLLGQMLSGLRSSPLN